MPGRGGAGFVTLRCARHVLNPHSPPCRGRPRCITAAQRVGTGGASDGCARTEPSAPWALRAGPRSAPPGCRHGARRRSCRSPERPATPHVGSHDEHTLGPAPRCVERAHRRREGGVARRARLPGRPHAPRLGTPARRHAATAHRSASRQLNEATCEGAPSGTAPRGEREGPTPLGRDPRRRENGTRALRPGLATRSSPAANSGRHSSRPAAPRGRPRPPPACGGGRAARGGGKRLPPQRGRLTKGHSCTN